jgi:hypothetical protein
VPAKKQEIGGLEWPPLRMRRVGGFQMMSADSVVVTRIENDRRRISADADSTVSRRSFLICRTRDKL